MKINACLAAIITVSLASPAPADRLVVSPVPGETPESHRIIKVFGREYWTWSAASIYANPAVPVPAQGNAALTNLPCFRDCALEICGSAQKPLPPGKGTHRLLKDYWTETGWARDESVPKPHTPNIYRASMKRHFTAHGGEIDLDMDDYRAWRARHPDFWGWEALDEWGNDSMCLLYGRMHKADPERRAEMEKLWGKTCPKTRAGVMRHLRKFFDRAVAKFYGDPKDIIALRGIYGLDHIAAAWGVKQVWVETTDTTSPGDVGFRWDVVPAFTRGASRQFRIPWAWYVAIFQNGLSEEDGKTINESYTYLPPVSADERHRRAFGPFGGVSESIERRCFYYAYVNGSGGVQREGWTQSFLDRGPDGREKPVLSRRGENYSAFHDFTLAHPDRGVTYAPVALLTPFDAGYSALGGEPFLRCPYDKSAAMMDATFFTLVPGSPRKDEIRRRGYETAMRNSPYAQMYDVLVPDSPQPADEFQRALAAYPAAVLIGEYTNAAAFGSSLADYVKRGGTLFVNAKQVPNLLTEDFTGVKLGATEPCGKAVTAADGKALFALTDAYEVVTFDLQGAKPILKDELGHVLAAVHDVGRGRVVTMAPAWLVPTDGARGSSMVATMRGARKHPFVDWIFTELQRDLCPITLSGDVLYGLNRTPTGWWIWAFNNKGVSKYADRHARIYHEFDTVVRVNTSKLGGAFRVRELVTGRTPSALPDGFAFPISAGEFAIFELKP